MSNSPTKDTPHELLGAGRYLRLVRRSGWEFAQRIDSPGVVAIVAVTDDGRLLLTEQFRQPVEGRVIDLPAGLVESGEEFESAALRELLEETGYRADALTEWIIAPSSPGLTSEVVTYYRARGLEQMTTGGGDDSEAISVHAVPIPEIDGWLAEQRGAGCHVDPKVYVGLYLLRSLGCA